MKQILIINGPNLSLLGKRQTDIYDKKTLLEIIENLKIQSKSKGYLLSDYQSNSESDIISFLNDNFLAHTEAEKKIQSIIINLGAFTHTSIAIRDALEMFYSINIPIYEVHLSNIFARESFRHHSYVSSISKAVICGMGAFGYEVALQHALRE